jgi:hypothetical protein
MKKFIPIALFIAFLLMVLSCNSLASGFSSPATVLWSNHPGTPPVSWQGIPIMPGATLGGEFAGAKHYDFIIKKTSQQVKDYYLREMPPLGWTIDDVTGDTGSAFDDIRIRFIQGAKMIAIFISDAGSGYVHVLID